MHVHTAFYPANVTPECIVFSPQTKANTIDRISARHAIAVEAFYSQTSFSEGFELANLMAEERPGLKSPQQDVRGIKKARNGRRTA